MEGFSHKSSTWEAPIELQRSTPREVTLTAAGKAALMAMFVLILGAVVGSALLAAKAKADAERWTAWQAESVSTQGVVTGSRKRGSGDDTKYWVDYTYRAGESTQAASAKIGSREWRRIEIGSTIAVEYRRSNPAQSWIPGHEPRGMPPFVPVLVGLSLLLPSPIAGYLIHRQKRLLEEGRAARATVVKTKKIHHQHGVTYRVAYEFETLSGGLMTGKMDVQGNAPAEGSDITILYHPDEPTWNARYPLSLVKVASNG